MVDNQQEENLMPKPETPPEQEKQPVEASETGERDLKEPAERSASKESSEQVLKQQVEELQKAPQQPATSDDAAGVGKKQEDENLVNELLKIAKIKGSGAALEQAKKMLVDDYVIDRLHDRMIEENIS